MSKYQFWSDPCRGQSIKSPPTSIPSASREELASYIVTDWQPYGYSTPEARATVSNCLDSVLEPDSDYWTIKNQNRLLTRGWKSMLSEALGIAYSRHSARIRRGYNFCVHVDHFIGNGIFANDSLSISKRHNNILRPDYLLAAHRFNLRDGANTIINEICGSMEVKGQGNTVLRIVPAHQTDQAENIELEWIDPVTRNRTPINLQQNLLSMVRVNGKLLRKKNRRISVRHSNHLKVFQELPPENSFFVPLVLAHYLSNLNKLYNFEYTASISRFYNRTVLTGDQLRRSKIKDAIQKTYEESSNDASLLKAENSEGIVSLSEPLARFLNDVINGNLLEKTDKSKLIEKVSGRLKEIEDYAAKIPTDKIYCRPDGFIFRIKDIH